MKVELYFNESIFKDQMKLLYDLGYGRKKAHLKNSNYLGFIFFVLGILITIGKSNLGYIFSFLGLIVLIRYYYFYFKDKELLRKFEKEQDDGIKNFRENPRACFEINDEGLIYSDFTGEYSFIWDDFGTVIEKNDTIFLITKEFQPFIIGKSETGEGVYKELVDLIGTKLLITNKL